jgi:DNA-binding response OmpR family regulator
MCIIDDSSFSINGLTAMKFSVKNKVDFSTRAASGIEKIELMLQKRKIYHIIFLKLNLPKKNGFEVNL